MAKDYSTDAWVWILCRHFA